MTLTRKLSCWANEGWPALYCGRDKVDLRIALIPLVPYGRDNWLLEISLVEIYVDGDYIDGDNIDGHYVDVEQSRAICTLPREG